MNPKVFRQPVGALIVGLFLAAIAHAESPRSAHWKSKMQMEGGPQGDVAVDSEVWTRDKKTRMKMVMMGMNMYVVKSGDFVYQWPEGQKSGMKFSTTTGQRNQTSSDYVEKIEEYRTKGKKTGTETIDGHVCDIYEMASAGAGGQEKKEKVWIAKDLDFPLKYVVESGKTKMTATNSEIELKASVEDSIFTPPSDITFQDMTEMMKGMQQQQQPQQAKPNQNP